MTEHDIQNAIRAALSEHAIVFRVNVGSGYTKDGRYVTTGVPPGFPDLFGFRLSDNRMFFIEVKKPGGSVRPQQIKFINQMRSYGAIAGICYSVDDALKLISEDN